MLDGHVTRHVAVARDESRAYHIMALLEEDPKTQVRGLDGGDVLGPLSLHDWLFVLCSVAFGCLDLAAFGGLGGWVMCWDGRCVGTGECVGECE